MARFASGKKSKAISDISGFEVKYTQLKTTWDNLRVEPEEYSPKHPQLTPARNVVDATALFNPRPDNDPENVTILYGFTHDIFASRVVRSQQSVSIKSFGRIGQVGISLAEPLTGLVGTTAIGNFLPGFVVTGVAGTGNVNDATAQDQVDVNTTGVAGSSTIGNFQTGAVITGVQSTGAINNQTINNDRIFELADGGVVGTSATGIEIADISTGVQTGQSATGTINSIVPNADIAITGVSGTSGIGTFGEEGNGTLNLNVLPTGATATANAGVEVAESEIPETNTTGWGENAFGTGVWGGDGEIRGITNIGDVTMDIFNGPNPQSGIQATGTVNQVIFNQDITFTTGWGINGWGENEFGGTDVTMGLRATGTVNTVSINQEVNVTGVQITGSIGSETVGINNAYGEGAWNDGTWGN